MSEYERLVQDRRDADRARNNDWKARALKYEQALRVWCIPAMEAAQEHAETYQVHRKWVQEIEDALRYARAALDKPEGK